MARADLVATLQGIKAVQGAMESWRRMAAAAAPAPPSTTTAPATPIKDAMDVDDKDVDMGDEPVAAGGGSGEPTPAPTPTPTRPLTAAERAAEAVSLRQTQLVEDLMAKVEAAKRAAAGGGDDGTLRVRDLGRLLSTWRARADQTPSHPSPRVASSGGVTVHSTYNGFRFMTS